MEPWWNRLAEAWARILAERWAAEQERKAKSQSPDGDPMKTVAPPVEEGEAMPTSDADK
jgi:hypothetical protein